ncbi:MAG: hypothetical protein WCT18_01165 [Patescibacteria group bacterium]
MEDAGEKNYLRPTKPQEVKMDDKRKLEIATKLIIARLRKYGITIDRDFWYTLEKDAKEIGITATELFEFFEPILRQSFEEMITPPLPPPTREIDI